MWTYRRKNAPILILTAAALLFFVSVILLIFAQLTSSQATDSDIEVEIEDRHWGQRNHVIVRTGMHGAYERVVFDWLNPVDYKVESMHDRILISFYDTSPVDVSHIADELGDYVLDAWSERHDCHMHVFLKLRANNAFTVWPLDDLVVVDVARPNTRIH